MTGTYPVCSTQRPPRSSPHGVHQGRPLTLPALHRYPRALSALRRRRSAGAHSAAGGDAAAPATFGTLPWHVLEVLMAKVTARQDVDAVRAARLVCRSWNAAVDASIGTAIMRPMTRSCQDVDWQERPIGVAAGDDGVSVSVRCVTALPCAWRTRVLIQRSVFAELLTVTAMCTVHERVAVREMVMSNVCMRPIAAAHPPDPARAESPTRASARRS